MMYVVIFDADPPDTTEEEVVKELPENEEVELDPDSESDDELDDEDEDEDDDDEVYPPDEDEPVVSGDTHSDENAD